MSNKKDRAPMVPVILSGGSGTRLWPVSRRAHPKPFMRLVDGESLAEKTFRRALSEAGAAPVLTVTSRDYYFYTRDLYDEVDGHQHEHPFLLEPIGRNTAPAIALAALYLEATLGAEAVMLVLPADHLIRDERRFTTAVEDARTLAEQGYLVTFGVHPTHPETGYGYIRKGDAIEGSSGHSVAAFVEKPDEVTARDYVRSGRYDLVVVDCAPTAETLRLLSLPDALSWYMEKLFPMERRFAKVVRPVLSRVVSVPLPGDEVFEAGEGFYARIDGVRRVLSNPEITSARLVVNLEKMVVGEARRTYTYLGLFGYSSDAVVVNRILPDEVTDPYFERWRELQAAHLAEVEEGFADLAMLRLRLFDEEMVGVERLRTVGRELYGDRDPTERLADVEPFRIETNGDLVELVMRVPFAERGDLDVLRSEDELYVTVGPYRRSMVLPDSLRRRTVRGAGLTDGVLRVRFGADDG